MTRKPTTCTDDDGYSGDLAFATLTKSPDESFWRFEIEVQDYSFTTQADINQAARVVIAAATDLLNRNKGHA